MNARQERFVFEYCTDMNATQAAIRAGYSAKTARSIGQRLLTFVDVKAAIEAQLERIHSDRTASAQEVEEYLTRVLRGESHSEIVIVEGVGDGCSSARRMEKTPDERERLKAAEILAKRHGLLESKLKLEGALPVFFTGEKDLKD